MTTMTLAWMFVAVFVCVAVFIAIKTTIAVRKHRNRIINSTTDIIVMNIKMMIAIIIFAAIPAMLYPAIIKEICFFDIFLEGGLKWVFYVFMAAAPIYFFVSRKEISEDAKEVLAIVGIVRNE